MRHFQSLLACLSVGIFAYLAPAEEPKIIEPTPEQLKEAKEKFAKLGATERPMYNLTGRGYVPCFGMPPETTDTDLKNLPDVPFSFGLTLRDTKITDAGLAQLRRQKQLCFLSLLATNVIGTGLSELKDLRGLTELDLDRTKITDTELKQIKNLPNLISLGLDFVEITDEGIKELSVLENLSELGLEKTKITDSSVKQLKQFSKLSYLCVSMTKITGAGVEEIQQALPKCRILHR